MDTDPLFDDDEELDRLAALRLGLIGRMLMDPEAAEAAFTDGNLRPRHMTTHRERLAVKGIREIWRTGETPTPAAVAKYARENGKHTPGFDEWLVDVQREAIGGSVVGHAEILAERWQFSLLEQVGKVLSDEARSRRLLPRELRDQAQKKLDGMIDGISDPTHARTYLEILMEKWQGGVDHNPPIPTGLSALDRIVGGGRLGQLWIIAAAVSMGKTAAAVALAYRLSVINKVPGVFFSLEMTGEEIDERLIAYGAEVSLTQLRGEYKGKRWGNIIEEKAKISESPLWVEDSPDLGLDDVTDYIRKQKRDSGIKFFVIDQLLLMNKPPASRFDLQLQEITSGLKKICRREKVWGILLHQIRTREVEKRADQTPRLSDLRDAPVENDADIVVMPHRPAYYQKGGASGAAEDSVFVVAKQRNGPTGHAGLRFDPPSAKWVDRSIEEQDPQASLDDGVNW